jgi:glycosyltransferase involved in cell wall biosynthesis
MVEGTAYSVAPAGPTPRISIGLPVFNGENYLAKTLAAILAQTYTDFELIICDNASSDATQSICEAIARQDARVRYCRNEVNLGAGPNFDRCFHLARGEYFKWAAHDDLMAPTYLEKTAAALDANPDAILCTTGIHEIGPDDQIIRTYQNHLPGINSTRAHERLAGMTLYRHQCEDIFGLLRRRKLEGSQLHGLYLGSDRVFLAEIALRGRCIAVNEPLFLHREHKDRYTRAILLGDRKSVTAWQNTSGAVAAKKKRRQPALYHWLVYSHLWGIVNKNVAAREERLACYRVLVRWWFTDYHFFDFVKDLLLAISPQLLARARGIKRALFGVSDERPGSLTPQG